MLAAEGVPADRLIPLYNPIDVVRFAPLEAEERARRRAALGFRPSDVLAGFAGRMEQSKGLIPLREALSTAMTRQPDLHMVWIGDGAERAATESFVQDSGHRARHRFLGWQTEIEKFMPLLDFLVVPSLAPETFGRVAAEAQACGVPVIVSAAGGLVEALAPGRTGVLLGAPVDSTRVCGAIESLARDPELRARFGAAGVEFVRSRFAAERIAAAFVENLRRAPFALPMWEFAREPVGPPVWEPARAPVGPPVWEPAREAVAPPGSVISHIPLGN